MGKNDEWGKRGREYEETEDDILNELKSLPSFLYHHFKDAPYYKQMLPSSHQPARVFDSTKTHKFDCFSDINVTNLKLRPIVVQENFRNKQMAYLWEMIDDLLQGFS